MNKDKSHKTISASSISKILSNDRTTGHKSKEKLSKTAIQSLYVTKSDQTHNENYNDYQNGTRTHNLLINCRIITTLDNYDSHEDKIADGDEQDYELEYEISPPGKARNRRRKMTEKSTK